VKNTPPSCTFEENGKKASGPPVGIAKSYEAKVGEPLALTLWASDEAHAEETPAAFRTPPLTLSWSKFRGPGSVTFANARPDVAKPDGKAATSATFGAPGEYVLRVQLNDSSGDGGGGSQCCWTNVHVKVSVR
jgi:hypothetical protein